MTGPSNNCVFESSVHMCQKVFVCCIDMKNKGNLCFQVVNLYKIYIIDCNLITVGLIMVKGYPEGCVAKAVSPQSDLPWQRGPR